LFADCYGEVNGVANTMRHLTAFARQRELPLLCVRAGAEFRTFGDGSVRVCEYRRSVLRVPADQDLYFDPLFPRLLPALYQELKAFQPDLIHISGPGDCGILGTLLSRALHLPMVASWHTNVHEFAARRLHSALSFFPAGLRGRMTAWTERSILNLAALYYRIPRLILAPNPELAQMLGERTGRPVHPMARGVDTVAFRPLPRPTVSGPLRFGYVGRLTPEKNVRLLVEAERMLCQMGARHVEFLIVGDGGERAALAAAMPRALFTGVLTGDALTAAYSSMDAMLFPSHTDTYGNVVLEAQACGTPVLVTASGGPKYLVEGGVSGWVASDDADFLRRVAELTASPATLTAMRAGARRNAERRSWHQVFADLYASYDAALAPRPGRANNPVPAGA
jgi:glycosyltransferase involved in cell wall biosynthesis